MSKKAALKAVKPEPQKEELVFMFKHSEVNTIMANLGKLPYQSSAPLIKYIEQVCQAQLSKLQKASAEVQEIAPVADEKNKK